MSGESDDVIKSLNKVKISINENDQVLWECQAAAKSYNEATEKLKEKCEQVNAEMAKIDEEICELEPHVEILASCYETQFENLTLIPASLINQRQHKKCIAQNIQKHQEEVDRLVDEYSLYIQKRKEKLELTNPAYRTLRAKKTELKLCKVRCLDLKQKIAERKRINKQIVEIRRKLFYGDIIAFAKSWLIREKYLNAMKCLDEEKRIERDYIKKLADVTELIKQQQITRFCQKESCFKIPQIEFPKADTSTNIKELPEKANRQLNTCFNDIRTMLEKKDVNMTHPIRNDNLKFGEQNKGNIKFGEQNKPRTYEFNASQSKVRILENRTLRPHKEIEKLLPISKEERSKAIAAKLQKVVENFKKNISRQNSAKSITSSQERSSQKTCTRQENSATKMEVVQDTPSVEYGATEGSQQLQNLNITNMGNNNPETMFLSQESNNNFNQSSKNQYRGRSAPHLSQETECSIKRDTNFTVTPQDNFGNKRYSQENRNLTKGSATAPMVPVRQIKGVENTFGEKSKFTMSTPGFGGQLNMDVKNTVKEMKSADRSISFKKPEAIGFSQKPHFIEQTNNGNPSVPDDTSLKKPIFVEKNQFMMGDSGLAFNSNINNRIQGQDEARKPIENPARDNETYTKMGGMPSYNFGNDTQLSQILNTSYEYGEGYASPQFDQSYLSPEGEDNNINTVPNFGGPSNFTEQSLFSFGQMNSFSFK